MCEETFQEKDGYECVTIEDSCMSGFNQHNLHGLKSDKTG